MPELYRHTEWLTRLAYNHFQKILIFVVSGLNISGFTKDTAFYYPPRAVHDLYTGIYRVGYVLFVYNGAFVPWIISVNNFQFTLSRSAVKRPF